MESVQQQVSQLSAEAQKEVLAFIQKESAQAKIQSSVTGFTDRCFTKCCSEGSGSTVNAVEEQCLRGCLNAFLDTNIKVVHILQSMQK